MSVTVLANLGDGDTLDAGSLFVYSDGSAELVQVDNDYLDDDRSFTYTVYRWDCDRCTFINGILSANRYDPDHSAWFAPSDAEMKARPQDGNGLRDIANFVGMTTRELRTLLCSDDVLKRAVAYNAIGRYHGYDNLDSDPLTFNRAEAEARYGRYAGAKMQSGYCFVWKGNGKYWDRENDEDWETEVYTPDGRELPADQTEEIDGAKHIVFLCNDGNWRAQLKHLCEPFSLANCPAIKR